jgi:hypothetical protein
MTVGNPKIKVTRTDVARYLNIKWESFPKLAKFWEQYMSKCGKARRESASQFGFWLRENRPKEFNVMFVWAKSNMTVVLDEIYADVDSSAHA